MMSNLPQVLVTGFARSGTSFLTNLIEVMGFSAGKRKLLKPPAASNPRGYWEFMLIRDITWRMVGVSKRIWQHLAHTMPDEPLQLSGHRNADKIRRLARRYSVEVYKDSYLPVFYKLFPQDAKYVVIKRDWRAIHASHMKVKNRPGMEGEFRNGIDKYYKLAQMMAREVDCLFVQYEQFQDSFDVATVRLADFLGVECGRNLGELREVWCPNPPR